MEKLLIGRETFSVLSSETRIEILKELDERQKTLTELARAVETSKPAVYKHLRQLEKVGLVKKEKNPQHKWKYYFLTRKGQHLLHPKKLKIQLLLGTAAITLVGAVVTSYLYLQSLSSDGTQIAGEGSEAEPVFMYLSIVLVFISIVSAFASWFFWKQKEGEEATVSM